MTPMRLILRFTEGDGCTYSATHTYPVEYESAEALLVHFMEAALTALQARQWEVPFLGETFSSDCFFSAVDADYVRRHPDMRYIDVQGRRYLECPPEVMTVDEFFREALAG